MFKSENIHHMAKEFVGSLPPGLQVFREEVEKLLADFLQQTLRNMALVTREEFDIQTHVLAKTRKKLEDLEQVLRTLAPSHFTTE